MSKKNQYYWSVVFNDTNMAEAEIHADMARVNENGDLLFLDNGAILTHAISAGLWHSVFIGHTYDDDD